MRCWYEAVSSHWLEAVPAGDKPAPCADDGRLDECAAQLEVHALRHTRCRADREHGRLRLHTGAGPLQFDDGPLAGGGEQRHHYLGCRERGALHLLLRSGPTGEHRYLLVNERSGRLTELDELPQPSPSGRRLAVVSGVAAAGRGLHLTVFAHGTHGWTPEWHGAPVPEGLRRRVRWLDEQTLAFQSVEAEAAASPRLLRRHERRWRAV